MSWQRARKLDQYLGWLMDQKSAEKDNDRKEMWERKIKKVCAQLKELEGSF